MPFTGALARSNKWGITEVWKEDFGGHAAYNALPPLLPPPLPRLEQARVVQWAYANKVIMPLNRRWNYSRAICRNRVNFAPAENHHIHSEPCAMAMIAGQNAARKALFTNYFAAGDWWLRARGILIKIGTLFSLRPLYFRGRCLGRFFRREG